MLHIGRERLDLVLQTEGDLQSVGSDIYSKNFDAEATEQNQWLQTDQDMIEQPIKKSKHKISIKKSQKEGFQNDKDSDEDNDDDQKQQEREIISFESINRLDKERQHQWKKFNFSMSKGWFSKLFLVDLLTLLFHTRKVIDSHKEVRLNDIPHLFPEEQTNNTNQKFEKILFEKQRILREKGKDLGPIGMLSVFYQTFKSSIILEFLLLILMMASKIVSSVCIRNLISDVSSSDDKSKPYMWAGIIAACNIVFVLVMHHSNKINYTLYSRIRVMFMKSLYMKISNLSAFTVKEANIGKLVNLVSGDLTSIEIKSFLIMNLPIIPFGLLAIAVILYFRFGWYGVAGLGLMMSFIPIQIIVANLSSKVFAMKSGLVDKRVNYTNEVVEGIRLIKMYAWEGAFKKAIVEIRKIELKKVLTIFTLFVFEHALSFSSGFLGCFFIFILTHKYGDVSNLSLGNMFATLDLLSYARINMISFAGYGLGGALELKVILSRMVSIFKIVDTQMTCIEGKNDYEHTVLEKGEVRLKNFNAYWKGDEPVLKNVTLDIKQGECVSIVGKIGSGKSTLLNCILKEVPRYKGAFCYKGKIAYVEQEPFIFSSTVRDNIIFGRKYKESFYNDVVKVCNLSDDFKIFNNGDLTEIGERGANISGGQKARISLARAIYSQADIYLFDDPLSAVDAKVASSLFREAIQKFLKKSTVLLVTHQIHFTRWTDRIIIMNEGQITDQGTFEDLEQQLKELANQIHLSDESSKNSFQSLEESIKQFENDQDHYNPEDQNNKNQDENNANQPEKEDSQKQQEGPIQTENNDNQENIIVLNQGDIKNENEIEPKKIQELYTKESSENSEVTFQTYVQYLKASKMMLYLPLLTILFFGSEVINIFFTQIIGYYGKKDYNSDKIINGLGYLTIGYFGCLIFKYFLLIKIENKSSETLHNKMLDCLVRSKVLYFDQTQSGRIINRFSTDLIIVDQGLPLTSLDAIEIVCVHITLLIMIVIINPYFLIVAFIQFLVLYYFLKVSKICLIESKQVDLRNRSPVFNYFTSTIQGVLPIRVYEQVKIFQYKFDELSDNSLRSSLLYWYNSRAFGAYIHMFSTITGIIGIFMLIAIGKSGSDVGQSVVYFLTMSDTIQWGLRQIIQTDVTMSSTKRILNMCEIPSEPELITKYDEDNVKKSLVAQQDNNSDQVTMVQEKQVFPPHGKVEFQNVRMRYREGLDPVLNNLTFTIEPGMRVGCIGRTGAGKSSILQALFRMTEIDEPENQNEEIAIKIDGHNTRKLGLHTLRGGISMIPQIPFIFSGTILRNLDPLNEYSLEQVMNVLSDIGLREKINSLEKGILTDMTNASEVFSVGQKQLICLGRAILKKSKLLILDEATANVDMNTDELIQNKIKERFTDSTVITVAHRLNTIADYDMIIVMDKGAVLETGTPYLLLQNDKSAFKAMVDHTGKKNSKAIIDIAKNAYEQQIEKNRLLNNINHNQIK